MQVCNFVGARQWLNVNEQCSYTATYVFSPANAAGPDSLPLCGAGAGCFLSCGSVLQTFNLLLCTTSVLEDPINSWYPVGQCTNPISDGVWAVQQWTEFLCSSQECRAKFCLLQPILCCEQLFFVTSCFIKINFHLISSYSLCGERLTSSTNSGTSFSSPSPSNGTLPSVTSTAKLGDKPNWLNGENTCRFVESYSVCANSPLGICTSQSFWFNLLFHQLG